MVLNQRPIRSYVRRQGRMTRAQKQALQTWWEQFGLLTSAGVINIKQVFAREAPTVLEIGFGNGQTLLQMAAQQPELNFIGIEVHQPGIGAVLQGIVDLQLTNIRIYQEDAVYVLEHCIQEKSLHKIQIFFPDPWPKKRHHKRRLIQPAFIQLLHSKLLSEGILHMATDWQDYAQHMTKVMSEQSGWRYIDIKNMTNDDCVSHRIWRLMTKFEQRGRRLGHEICDLVYQSLDYKCEK